jgi:hypothetical protein
MRQASSPSHFDLPISDLQGWVVQRNVVTILALNYLGVKSTGLKGNVSRINGDS